ncbi:MAG: Hpt domain-containing protein [Bdellovibrionaceae bacterium]|nr:Hpt domain-containing protein [Pseudobdellovibrionaceae bacterium]
MKKKSTGRKNKTAKESALNDLFTELKGEYLDSFAEKFAAIEKFWQEKDRAALRNEFHKMKGTGSTYGLPEVSVIAEMLEDMCSNHAESLGLSILVALRLLQKVAEGHRHATAYEYQKDSLFHELQSLYQKMESAA